jgi:TolA-binding protein
MNQRLVTAVLSMLLAGATAWPASAATKEQLQMMADLRMLQEQSQQLQILLGSLTEALKGVSTRLEQRLDQQNESARKSFADQKMVIDTLATDLRVVREKVDDSNVRIGSLSQEVDALRQSVVMSNIPGSPVPADPNAPSALPPGTASTPGAPSSPGAASTQAAVPPAPPAPSSPPAAMPVAPGTSPQRLWDMAFAEYGAGRYDLAVMGFEAYIKSFPRSDMADEAQVYICGSYLHSGAYQKAVDACDVAIRTYPTGNALPEAYYRKGVALQSLQQLAPAGATFELLLKTYPDTVAATLAQQRLEALRRP